MELLEYEKKHLEAVYEGLAECTLFLKRNETFPLEKPCKIAAFGAGVKKTVKGGTGSGEVNSRFTVNIYDGLVNAGFDITTDKWFEGYNEAYEINKKVFIKELKKKAKAAHTNYMIFAMGAVIPEPEYNISLDYEGDAAIYVVSRISGEGNDRNFIGGDIRLTNTEIREINELNKKFSKFLLVLNVGGVVDLSSVSEVENVLLLSQLGTNTGTLLADIMLGKKNPSGKLTTTWAKSEDYLDADFGDINDTRYKEGIYVGYRYFDSFNKKALFPFGFGKSYSEFSISNEEVSLNGTTVEVKATVTNTSSVAGKEVVQAYVSCPCGKLDKAYQDLAGFKKSNTLKANESEVVAFEFDLKSLASYDEESGCYILEKGNYIVRVGNSSVNTKEVAAINLDETVVTLKAKNIFNKPDFTDLVSEKREFDVSNLKVLPLKANVIETKEVNYNVDYPIEKEIDELSLEDLCFFTNGNFSESALAAIGVQSKNVPGAAGETSEKISICKQTVMSDGPAGLRLSRDYFVDKKGIHAIGTSIIPQGIMDLMDPFMKFILSLISGGAKPKKGTEILHQYCTDIPIGTALAQSFNLEYATKCGDIVGDEMERFHVNLWLAPAFNIHRTIRCGRNFEYFSEDPLISGLFGSAITNGVQKHPTCGTTIKHYAFNNQETNRYASNSIVSERAIREIYTKGFGICVKESQPEALMTSYNLINGTHTSESRPLIEELLRNEYGYKGVVMTDWILVGGMPGSLHRDPIGNKMAAAGNDLVMPGGKKHYDNILEACKTDEVLLKQVKINASRVYRMNKKLAR